VNRRTNHCIGPMNYTPSYTPLSNGNICAGVVGSVPIVSIPDFLVVAHFLCNIKQVLNLWRVVAEWLERRTLNQRVVGSNPGEGTAWYL
jgi:hypothetical protein